MRKTIKKLSDAFSPQSMQTPMERHSLIEEAGHLWSRLSGGVSAENIRDVRIGFVSTFSGEGTTTVAANFARFLSRRGARTAIVEANLRSPGLARQFRAPAGAGLWDLVERTARFSEAARQAEGLTMLAAGNPPHDFTNDFDYRHVVKVADFLQKHHQVTVVDAPPLGSSPEAVAILRTLHQVVLVVRANETKRDHVERSIATLQSLGVNCAGVVLNDVHYELPAGLARAL